MDRSLTLQIKYIIISINQSNGFTRIHFHFPFLLSFFFLFFFFLRKLHRLAENYIGPIEHAD
jgi:hypothetical protein